MALAGIEQSLSLLAFRSAGRTAVGEFDEPALAGAGEGPTRAARRIPSTRLQLRYRARYAARDQACAITGASGAPGTSGRPATSNPSGRAIVQWVYSAHIGNGLYLRDMSTYLPGINCQLCVGKGNSAGLLRDP